MLPTLILAGGLAGLVSAHKGCGGAGHEVVRRNPGGVLIDGVMTRGGRKRADTNPCIGYTYAPTQGLAAKYPPIFDIATILPSDTAARALFNSIDSRVRAALPHTVPRGTPSGDRTGVVYDAAADPDCWWTYSQCTTPSSSTGLEKDITTVPEPGSMGLSYDDGPHCANAPLYKWMKDNEVRASLYYIGGNILSWPLQAIDGYEGGHEMCIHSWSHHNEQVFAEFYYSQRIMKDVVGVTPKCWRPPYGDVDNRVRMFAEGLGLRTHIWSEDTDDWTLDNGASPEKVSGNYQSIINDMRNGKYATFGPVVLSHENSEKTINEALKFLPSLKSTFVALLPIATAYNMSHPYAESNVTYPSFAQYSAGRNVVIVSSALPSSTPSASSTAAASTVAPELTSPSSGTSNQLAQSTSGGKRAVSVAGGMAVLVIVAATLAGLGVGW